MFLIASAGRAATAALCHGLDKYSDHVVRHEPEPMLEEAYLKHHGRPYQSDMFCRRMDEFKAANGTKYGESVRAPNLLPEMRAAAPNARVVVIVRDPTEYLISAYFRRILLKEDEWDRLRLMPLDSMATGYSVRVLWHWHTVNQYLLDFAESDLNSKVIIHGEMVALMPRFCDLLGVEITDRQGLTEWFSARPNKSETLNLPADFAQADRRSICDDLWSRAERLAA